MRSRVIGLALAAAGFLGVASFAPSAGAVTVSIGLQTAAVNGGALTEVASAVNATAIFSGAYGAVFTNNTISASGAPPLLPTDILNSTTENIAASAGVLTIVITSQDNTSPLGFNEFISGFTSNALPAGWSVTEQTFLDTGNGKFTTAGATVVALGSHTFNAIGTDLEKLFANTGAGPYSLTHVYVLTATGQGSALSTIHLSEVPVPAALPLLVTALLGAGGLSRLRRRNRVSA